MKEYDAHLSIGFMFFDIDIRKTFSEKLTSFLESNRMGSWNGEGSSVSKDDPDRIERREWMDISYCIPYENKDLIVEKINEIAKELNINEDNISIDCYFVYSVTLDVEFRPKFPMDEKEVIKYFGANLILKGQEILPINLVVPHKSI